MITFANPSLLYLLFAIPVLAAIFLFNRWSRVRRLKKMGHLDVLQSLMPDSSKYMPSIKTVLQLLAASMIILAIGRPFIFKENIEDKATSSESTSGIEVMVCLDVSNSMLASSTDSPDGISRLQRAKFILEKMLNSLRNDKVGLIVFAGESYTQLPVTDDLTSAKMYLNTLSPQMVPTQGTAIGSAIDMAVNSFNPESPFQKAIIIITDAENFEDDAVNAAKQASKAGIQVDVIGIGTEKGAPIPFPDNPAQYFTFDNGEPVLTAFNPKVAKEIASAGHGIFIDGSSNSAVKELTDQLDTLTKTEYMRRGLPSNTLELYPIFIWTALLILIIDAILPYSKIKWLKKFNFFTK